MGVAFTQTEFSFILNLIAKARKLAEETYEKALAIMEKEKMDSDAS